MESAQWPMSLHLVVTGEGTNRPTAHRATTIVLSLAQEMANRKSLKDAFYRGLHENAANR